MITFLIKRVAMAFVVILLVLVLLTLVVHLVPGDPARIVLKQMATPERMAQIRHEMHLDKPILVQIWDFVSGAVQGDLGRDFTNQVPVTTEIGSVLPNTLILALSGVFLSIVVGLPLGVLVARHPNTLLDRVLGAISMMLISGLPYVIALALLLIFAVKLHWLPALGAGAFGHPLDYLRHLALPAVALAFPWWGYLPRFIRANMLEVLGSNYIRTARSFGFRDSIIFYCCALKNALVPVVALFGLMLGYGLAGTLYAETIFSRPGLGTLALDAVQTRNWPIIRGTVVVFAVSFIVGNLVSDLSYRLLDPRIRIEEGVEAPS